jgi:hypothetical protein
MALVLDALTKRFGDRLISPDATPVVILSFVPFFSPYLMLSRFGGGSATVPEVLLAIAISLSPCRSRSGSRRGSTPRAF